VQAIVRNDPGGFAARELAERQALRLPPAWRVAEITGLPSDVDDFFGHARLPESATVLGPVRVAGARRGAEPDTRVRALVVVPRGESTGLSGALRAALAIRSARKEGGALTVRVDPVVLG
jgi:primosomal protein N' (replication factor Y)